jgi:thymidylate synthase (FAD)
VSEGLELPTIPVLDHGFVRLVDHMGSDLSVVRAARVSYDAAWRAGENDGSDLKLLRYLWSHGHTTPFESVTFTFEVKAPIFVLRQWHRHRTQSYNELSARYRELPEEFYVPRLENVGAQSTSSKQGRNTDISSDLLPERELQVAAYRAMCQSAFMLYRSLLERGWPRELARMVLPTSTYSHMFVTMNLLNLLKFLTLRANSHAQYEIRVYADAMIDLTHTVTPRCIEIWKEFF